MKALAPLIARVRPLAERLDALSLRERALVFGAGVVLVYVAWQGLLMDPLAHRTKAAEQRLTEARRKMDMIAQAGTDSSQDPAVVAATRNRALEQRLASLDAELRSAAQGYVAPERMTELLRELLAGQKSLRLVSLANMPVESLSQAPGGPADAPIAADDRGPYLHPVEMVIEGDFASVVGYLRDLEALPWRLHWTRLELVAGDYPTNRVRIVIGALSLSRDWMHV